MLAEMDLCSCYHMMQPCRQKHWLRLEGCGLPIIICALAACSIHPSSSMLIQHLSSVVLKCIFHKLTGHCL